jgi:hypothetical protein
MNIHWSHGWGLVGQIATLWLLASILSAPFIGKWLRNRRVNAEFRALHQGALKNIARNRCASPESAPGEAVGSSPARALHPAVAKSDARWTDEDAEAKPFALDYRALVGNVADEMEKSGDLPRSA